MKPAKVAPIGTQGDCRLALKEIEGLMHAKRNTPEGDRLDVLVALVEAWEAKHCQFGSAQPESGLAVADE
jgi:HTH-type transcriptional regulator / antitoxin HigA